MDRLEGTLLGTALGDPYGPETALCAASLAREPADADACARAYRRATLGWVGRGTPCAIVGARHRGDAIVRARFARALSGQRDAGAVDAAVFAAELAALSARASADVHRVALVRTASTVVGVTEVGDAIDRAARLVVDGSSDGAAMRVLGDGRSVVECVARAAYVFARHGHDPRAALAASGGRGPTAALAGAWCGALHGASGLPADLLGRLDDGSFGPTRLRALARDLAGPPASPSAAWPLGALFARIPLALARLVPG